MEKYRKTWCPTRTRTPKSGYLKVSNLSDPQSSELCFEMFRDLKARTYSFHLIMFLKCNT